MPRRLAPFSEIKVRRAIVDRIIREDFSCFVERVFETVAPGEAFHANWHIEAIGYQLDRIRRGEITRLIINLPPRSLKSILGSVALPAFLLGHDPTCKIICASYTNELAAKHSSDFRAVVRSPWYRKVFPNMKIQKDSEAEIVTTKRGGRLSTSVNGTLTGRGGNLIIIDDPHKPEEAMSDGPRQTAVRWFETTVLSRLNDKAKDAIVVIMQRLHRDDLSGVLREKGGWEELILPAIAIEPQDVPIGRGEVIHRNPGDVLDGLRESLAVLESQKRAMGSMAFSAQYQQCPVPPEGGIIKKDWLKYCDQPPEIDSSDHVVISLDTAMKDVDTSDYTVATVWLAKREICHLLDLHRGQYDYPALKRLACALKRKWRGAIMLVEDRGSGTSLIQDLRAEGLSAIAISPTEDKKARLYGTQAQFESGSVLLPKQASWLEEFESELLGFPNMRHDDQVDSTSQALRWIAGCRRMWNIDIGMPISIPNDYRPYP